MGHCLDLTGQGGLRAVKRAYDSFKKLQSLRGEPMPENEDPLKSSGGDLVLRRLDRAVIDHLNALQDRAADSGGISNRFQTIRSLFPEGAPLYPNAGFRELTHVQLCVREQRQILAVFRIPEHKRLELGLPVLYPDYPSS